MAGSLELRQMARGMLRGIADGKAIPAEDARLLAEAVLHADELSRAALAVREAEDAFVLRRLIELCALIVEATAEPDEAGEAQDRR